MDNISREEILADVREFQSRERPLRRERNERIGGR
jgi:hypothetical protein